MRLSLGSAYVCATLFYHIMRDLLNATATKGIVGTIGSLTLAQWSHVASIVVAGITASYMVYKWVRDHRERTCDKAACPMRHRPE